MDMADAYKNVPCPLNDLHLQGFSWLGKFFVELRQIFGATTAVANYDILGNTVLTLVKAETEVPNHFVHRQLDDVPVVVPYSKKYWCEEFVLKYRVCSNWRRIALISTKLFRLLSMGKCLVFGLTRQT